MTKRTRLIVALTLVLALALPALAYATSHYVRKSSSTTVYSSGSVYYKQSNQGSVEDGGYGTMYASIQSYAGGPSWTTRRTVAVPKNGSASSSVAYNGNLYRWRLMLSGTGRGYGVLNAFN